MYLFKSSENTARLNTYWHAAKVQAYNKGDTAKIIKDAWRKHLRKNAWLKQDKTKDIDNEASERTVTVN